MNLPKIHKDVFILEKKENITPHMIRITLKGDVHPYKDCVVGVNNKIFIPPVGVKKVYFPEMGVKSDKVHLVADNLRPDIRTYTHRGIDLENNFLIIDFVNHGENGPASCWALHAKIGDKLGVAMKLKNYPLHPQADWYFLIGDATAVPVLSSILEALPTTAQGQVLLEVSSKEDEQNLKKPEAVDIIWLHNPNPEKGSQLAQKAREILIPENQSKFAYIAAEFLIVKALRKYFRNDLDWSINELNAYSYWKAGVAEDKSTVERQEEKKVKINE